MRFLCRHAKIPTAQDRESSPAKDQHSATVPCNQLLQFYIWSQICDEKGTQQQPFPINSQNFSRSMKVFVHLGKLTAHAVLTHIATSSSESDVIFEFSVHVFLYRHGHFRHAIPFSATSVKTMSAHVQ